MLMLLLLLLFLFYNLMLNVIEALALLGPPSVCRCNSPQRMTFHSSVLWLTLLLAGQFSSLHLQKKMLNQNKIYFLAVLQFAWKQTKYTSLRCSLTGCFGLEVNATEDGKHQRSNQMD